MSEPFDEAWAEQVLTDEAERHAQYYPNDPASGATDAGGGCTPSAPCRRADCRFCDGPDSWAPVDLGPYLRKEIKPVEPAVGMFRSDGLRLLYPGKEHSVIGEMESGKTWFCLACVAAELAAGHHVAYVHFEECDPGDTVERLQALGATDREILDLFRFVGPDRRGSTEAVARLLTPAPTLVVLDGVNEAMTLHGWKIREEDGAAAFRRYLVKPFTAAGAATLAADHVIKDRERRDRSPLGSIHKGNALNGALFLLENAEPFGRSQRGRSHVYVTKDRPGYLRRHGRATKLPGKTFLGELVVDDTQLRDPDLHLKLWAPSDEAPDRETGVVADHPDDDKVLAAIKKIVGMGQAATLRKVRAAAGLGREKVDEALARLDLAEAIVETQGPNRSRIFSVAEDPLPESGQ